MRRTTIVTLLISLLTFIPSQAQTKDKSAIDTIKQLEQAIGDAMVANDIEKLNQFYADDWAAIGYSGNVINKQTLLTDFKSFHDKLESFEIGLMNVQVFGNLAVAHGTVTEKRNRDGKDTSGCRCTSIALNTATRNAPGKRRRSWQRTSTRRRGYDRSLA